MENSLFFSNVEVNDNNAEIIKSFSEYSEKFSKQVYIIKSALGVINALEYDYDDYIVALLPGRKIVIIIQALIMMHLKIFCLILLKI